RRPGEQRRPARGEDLLDLRGHLACQQLCAEQRLAGQPPLDLAPLRRCQRQHLDGHVVRLRPRPLDPRGDHALGQGELHDLALSRVAAPALQPSAHPVRLEHGDEPPRPPLLADRAALAFRLDAAFDGDRGTRRLPPPRPVGWRALSGTASSESATTSRSCAVDSPASQFSPVPTICSARAFFSSIMASIRSSSVPTQTNLRTCTSRRWPIRNARSVAWSSTAGFHHRSTWMTWLAAVRFSPVPPALSDSRNSAGSAISWKAATIAS